MQKISDFSHYTDLMKKGFYDKMFFIDKLFGPWKSFFDFGCADGFITKMIAEVFPDKMVYGYDNDEKMIELARHTGSLKNNCQFGSEKSMIEKADVLLLSSVMHEIFSYEGEKEGMELWKSFISLPNLKYIVIRDTMPDPNFFPIPRIEETSFREPISDWCTKNGFLGEFDRFMESNRHWPFAYREFLLKYFYLSSPNWSREMHERYFWWSPIDYIVGAKDWRIEHINTYTLPYLKHKWREDFSIQKPFNTHCQLILARK